MEIAVQGGSTEERWRNVKGIRVKNYYMNKRIRKIGILFLCLDKKLPLICSLVLNYPYSVINFLKHYKLG